ncbi:dihydrofolate reductase [Blattabacterium sp. (Blaberus giganteus)]|uniref:dihydrofolate reductase n=1 Tax=Blattabacterium sp. (Blaberus giganteus) TaxID=1186051 RepID=UPI00025F6EBD|nr:dihydrofolate reductase [Blattabacterium sp. (Blaberus giganteus)]AFJ90638.1 dihydrofolate reductase [Blattabacterium sp. (Blaberus giganteus)]
MKIVLIAAISENGFIGKNNQLMWHLPNDLKRFKNLTMGETIIMGRKTFESIGKILPKRKNIILTKNKMNFLYLKNKKNIRIVSSIKEIENLTCKKIFVIGGEKTYASTIEKANIIELTLIHKKFHGDTKFPKIDTKKWKKTCEFVYEKDKYHLFNYSFIRFERKK